MFDWAPNPHAFLVHFPIGLLGSAAAVDVASTALPGRPTLSRLGTLLWLCGTALLIATYYSGREAATLVRTPGMAHPLVAEHWNWAWYATVYFACVSAYRVTIRPMIGPRRPVARVITILAAALGLFFLIQTADRGGQLVYEYGVGIAAPSRGPVD